MRRRTLFSLPAAALLEPQALEDSIRREIDGIDGTVCLYARNLDTNASFGLRENEKVRTASTIKLPIMAAAFAAVQAGSASWEELLTLRAEDKVSGSGVLFEFSSGVKLPLRDLVHLMIVVSDNTATNLVLDRITADAVNDLMDKLGLPATRSMRKVRGDGNQLKAPSGWSKAGLLEENKRFGLGSSTSREMVELLALLHKGEVVSRGASRDMLAILKRQQLKDGIGRKLGRYEVQSKSGSLDALRSDVGIVTTPKCRVAMAITVDGLKQVDYSQDNAGLLLISRLAPILMQGLGAL